MAKEVVSAKFESVLSGIFRGGALLAFLCATQAAFTPPARAAAGEKDRQRAIETIKRLDGTKPIRTAAISRSSRCFSTGRTSTIRHCKRSCR